MRVKFYIKLEFNAKQTDEHILRGSFRKRAIKNHQILCLDWLQAGKMGPYLAFSGLPAAFPQGNCILYAV